MYKFSPTIFYIYVSTWIFTILKFILICKSCYLTLRRASENLTVTLKWAKKYFCWKRSGSLCQGECLFRFFLKLWSKRRYLQMFWKIFFFKGPGDSKKKNFAVRVHCALCTTKDTDFLDFLYSTFYNLTKQLSLSWPLTFSISRSLSSLLPRIVVLNSRLWVPSTFVAKEITFRRGRDSQIIVRAKDMYTVPHKRRNYIEDKAKVVAALWGIEVIQVLAALAIIHMHGNLKNRMNSSISSYHPGAKQLARKEI